MRFIYTKISNWLNLISLQFCKMQSSISVRIVVFAHRYISKLWTCCCYMTQLIAGDMGAFRQNLVTQKYAPSTIPPIIGIQESRGKSVSIFRAKFPASTKNRTLVTCTHSNINILHSLCSVFTVFSTGGKFHSVSIFMYSYTLLL